MRTIIVAAGISALLSSTALAGSDVYLNQIQSGGTGNTANISQSGNGHTVGHSGRDFIQDGSGNSLSSTQTGSRAALGAEQWLLGPESQAGGLPPAPASGGSAKQDGTNNVVSSTQNTNSAVVTLLQQGNANYLSNNQGKDNTVVLVRQIGGSNAIWNNQNATGARGYNIATFQQTSALGTSVANRNEIHNNQTGNHSEFDGLQNGVRNTINSSQNGDGAGQDPDNRNLIFADQAGNDHAMTLSQDGFLNLIEADQDGSFQTMNLSQTGQEHEIQAKQIGSNHWATVSQSGTGHFSDVMQSGNGNNATINQSN